MPARRSSTVLLALALLASVLSVVATSSPATSATTKPAARASAARVAGQPPANYVIPATSFFAYPNRSGSERLAIRNRVIRTINSTWGGFKTPAGLARAGNGTIRIATWTFKDMAVAKALANARKRGVSVQVVAAKSANQGVPAWRWLKKQFGSKLYRPGHPETRDLVSFARECRGSCRGAGGTAHAKYFLFTNVGMVHQPSIVIQSSMNLTPMGYQGQWNQAEVSRTQAVYDAFMAIYRQTRIGRPVQGSYRNFVSGGTTSSFYPLHGARAGNDPVMGLLNKVSCTGATAGGNANGRTKLRIIQYSLYGPRGTWIAKKLRSLWSSGCDIKLIYAVSSRPVMSILRNGSGRGAIPVRQSVITNGRREIVKYNHSKWMTITGHFGTNTAAYVTMSGSANWSLFAFSGDEQVQTISSRDQALRHNNVFSVTWGQGSSHAPGYGIKGKEGRMAERTWLMNMPKEPTWGKGVYKYLTPEGE